MPDNSSSQDFGTEVIVPVPHQVAFIEQLLNATPPARFLLMAPPGSGKTVTLAAAAKALQAKRGSLRCLSIAPAALAVMWQEQMMRFGGLETIAMTPQMYRRLQAEAGAGVNVWSKVSSAVASIDLLKSGDRMEEVLAAGWDLVLLDEAHLSTDASLRGEVARSIWKAPSVAIAVAATQMHHDAAWIADGPRTTTVHWKYSDLVRSRIVPPRRIHSVYYTPSESERQIAARIKDLLGQAPAGRQAEFTAQILQRRLESSAYAFEQALRRLLTAETFGDTDLNDWSPDDLEEDSDVRLQDNSFQVHRQAGEDILALLEAEPTDSKWESCFQLLSNRGIGSSCSGILFTDFVDTATYLEFLGKHGGLRVRLISGMISASERAEALHEARSKPALLIATGASDGMDLSFTNQVIHYDLPWNPKALLQRFGRVERMTPGIQFFEHFYMLEKSSASAVLDRLREGMQAIEQEWQ